VRSLIAGRWGSCEHGFGSVVNLSVVKLSSVMCGHNEKLIAGGWEQCEHGLGSVDACQL
jgi:hypothetical protein